MTHDTSKQMRRVVKLERTGLTLRDGRTLYESPFYQITLDCGHRTKRYVSQGKRKWVRCDQCPRLGAS